MAALTIGSKLINEKSECFIIAEIGHNHQGSLETCLRMIKAAADSGVSAVKLQKRSNRQLFKTNFYNQPYNSENAFGVTYGNHRENLEFNKAEYLECKNYAIDLGIEFFATAFDFESVDFLAELNVPAFKMASGDITNQPLQKYIASIGKPVIISTGGATLEEIRMAVNVFEEKNCPVSILQCTAAYPPKYEELNLNVISKFINLFQNHIIGYSGHDNGIAMSLLAYALGARIIEKHFTLDRTMKGTDHSFSLEPQGMKKLVRDLTRARLALGDGEKKVYESELVPVLKMSKAIVAASNLKKGTVIEMKHLAFKSPGDGLKPYQLSEIIGKTLVKNVNQDENILIDDVN
jgi:N-acetylneuraminate synthase/sialic acid synthase